MYKVNEIMFQTSKKLTIMILAKKTTLLFAILLSVIHLGAGISQDQTEFTPKGILIGEGWQSNVRELAKVYENQSELVLGDTGKRKVHIWTEIVNSKGKEYIWTIEYSNGMSVKIIDQKIRYDRFRTYLEKTFRKKIWNKQTNQLESVLGLCKIKIIDKVTQKLVAEKIIILK